MAEQILLRCWRCESDRAPAGTSGEPSICTRCLETVKKYRLDGNRIGCSSCTCNTAVGIRTAHGFGVALCPECLERYERAERWAEDSPPPRREPRML